MEVELIQLRGASGAPDTLLDGEPYLDEKAETVYFEFLDDIKALRLDAQPAPAASGDASEVCMQISDNLDYGALVGGGGGLHYDDQPWRVPGLTPIGVTQQTFEDDVFAFPIEVTQSIHVVKLRTKTGATTSCVLGLRTLDGTVLFSADVGADAGVETWVCDVDLSPGLYELYLDVVDAIEAQCISGYTRQGPLTYYPISMQIT